MTAVDDVTKQMASTTLGRNHLQAKISQQSCEIAILTLLVRDAESAARKSSEDGDWAKTVALLLECQPAWWGCLPAAWRKRRIRRRLAFHGIFDSEAYLRRYPDVVEAKMEPLRHYLRHGMAEGRER